METGGAARTHPFALNINWNVDSGPIQSHGELHSPAVWDFTLPHLKLEPFVIEHPPTDYVIN